MQAVGTGRERHPQTVPTKLGVTTEKQPHTIYPPPTNNTLGTIPSRQVLYWQTPNPDSFIGLPDGEALAITPENMSPLFQG